MTTSKAGPRSGPAFAHAADAPRDDAQLWLVRHGDTEWSENGRHTGRTDLALTADGEAQARALRPMLADVHPVRVLSSPRARALDTARLAGLRVDETTEDLAEWDYGDYEGRTSDEIHETVPDWTIWTHGALGGESLEDVRRRADALLARVLPLLAEGPVVLVGHGHFSRALGARWIGMPIGGGAALLLDTAAPSVLGAEHGTCALRHWNLPNPIADA